MNFLKGVLGYGEKNDQQKSQSTLPKDFMDFEISGQLFRITQGQPPVEV